MLFRAPGGELLPIPKLQLSEHVRDVVLHRVGADTEPRADLGVRAALAQRLQDAPLGGRQDVGVAWPPAAIALHAPIV